MLIASEIKTKKLYLCSLSPDFSEDLKFMSSDLKKYIGKKRLLDIENRSGRKIAEKLNIPTIIFYGYKEGQEFPQLKQRCEEIAKLAKNSKLVVVKDAPHQIDFPSYIIALKEEIL